MIYLLLSIFFTTSLYYFFKIIENRGLRLFPILLVNYLSASICSLSFNIGDNFSFDYNSTWMPMAFLLGGLFVSTFFLMGHVTQKLGVGVASMASKLSMIVPIGFGLLVFAESVSVYKVLGILSGLVAIIFLSDVRSERFEFLPLILFLGCGLVDLGIGYFQKTQGSNPQYRWFETITFGGAFIFGLLFASIQARKERLSRIGVLIGILLGTCNYLSLRCMIYALERSGLDSSGFFTVNNIGVIMFGIISARYIFNERLSPRKKVALVFSILAISFVFLHEQL